MSFAKSAVAFRRGIIFSLFSVLFLWSSACLAGGVLWQAATLDGLMAGAYEGFVPLSDLPRHGNLGLGTFDALDGEMILLDGKVWQARVDGTVRELDAGSTPFAVAVRFTPERRAILAGLPDMKALEAALDGLMPEANLFHAARIDGRFPLVRVRSVPAQQKPYPPLAEAAKQQAVYELRDVEGTLVVLRCPPLAAKINLPGYHMHFLTKDRRAGGHVLGVTVGEARAAAQSLDRLDMRLPTTGGFQKQDFARDRSAETGEVER